MVRIKCIEQLNLKFSEIYRRMKTSNEEGDNFVSASTLPDPESKKQNQLGGVFDDDDDFKKVGDRDEENERLSKMCYCKRLCHKYDRNFLVVYGIQYANAGLKFLQTLAL